MRILFSLLIFFNFQLLFANTQTKDNPTDKQLQTLLDQYWKNLLKELPEMAMHFGETEGIEKWTDQSVDAIERRQNYTIETLAKVEKIDEKKLSAVNQQNISLFKYNLKNRIESFQFKEYLMPINQLGGSIQNLPETLKNMPLKKEEDAAQFLQKLKNFVPVIDNTKTLLKLGIDQGLTPPQITLRDVPKQIEALTNENILENPILSALKDFRTKEFKHAMTIQQREEFVKEAEKIVLQILIPKIKEFNKFFVEEYLPKTRKTIAASDLPNGKKWYEFQIKNHTSLTYSAQKIHDIGLAEVKRIRSEMEKIKDQVGFKGTLLEFFAHLNQDPKFFYTKEEDLLTGYRDIAKRIDYELPRLFKTLPRMTYGIDKIDDFIAPSAPGAYYNGGSIKAGKAGKFVANTYALNTRPKWEMEALTLHEAVPGHHLQIALQDEREVHEAVKRVRVTAFSEGWALYAESLGEDLGFYKDPYSKFGQLSYEMWRSIRLVVDTGIHALGWSREQAIQFTKENSGNSDHDIIVETDRYVVWPGQALAYKIGELKIKELRKKAETQLGKKFDIRQFHDAVLLNGALPLDVLEKKIDDFIVESKKIGNSK